MGSLIAALPSVQFTTGETVSGEEREPFVDVSWDENKYKISKPDMHQALRDGEPSIEIRSLRLAKGAIHMTAVMLLEGEEYIVAERFKEILLQHA